MTVSQRLDNIIHEKKLQKKMIAQAIGVPNTTLGSWVNRGGDFPVSYLIPLAEAIGVTPMFLLTGNDDYNAPAPENQVILSDDEMFLLNTYRSLDKEGAVIVANKAVEELRRVRASMGGESAPSKGA